jgi:tetratricopeptide (TPR) repeat protein
MILDIKTVAIAVRKALKEISTSIDTKAVLAIIRANLKYHDEEFMLLERSLNNELLHCFALKNPVDKNEQFNHIKSALKLLEGNFSKIECIFIVDVFSRAKGWEVDVEHIYEGNLSITQSRKLNQDIVSSDDTQNGYKMGISSEAGVRDFAKTQEKDENEIAQINIIVSPELRDRWEFLIKPANRGNIESQYALGELFIEDMNQDQANYWFSKAAESGHAKAQWYMGMCFLRGVGKVKDLDKAIYWLSKSADQNYIESQYQLGLCYYLELAKNEVAMKWLGKAAEHGHDEAKTFLNILER